MTAGKIIRSVLVLLLLCTTTRAYEYRYAAEVFLNDEAALVAANPAADTAIVTGRQGKVLTVIDLVSGAILKEIPLFEAPVALAVRGGGNQALVATVSGRLQVFDLASGGAVWSVEVGELIQTLSVDEQAGTVLLGTPGGLRVFDLSSGTLHPVPLVSGDIVRLCPGKAHHAVLSRADGKMLLQILDPDAGTVDAEFELAGEVAGIEMEESLGYVLLTRAEQAGLLLFDIATLEPAGTVLTAHPCEIVAVNPSTHRAFLSDSESGTLAVVDLEKKKLAETVRLFERTGPVVLDTARNVALVAHDRNLAIVQLENPVPQLSGIVPEEASAGAEGVQLSVTGSKFVRDSQTHFDRQPLDTAFADNEHLTAVIPPSHLELPGNVAIAVRNPPPGGGASNELTFRILTPLPQVTGLAPEAVTVGGSSFAMRVEGKGFLPASFVRLGKKKVEARFVSSTVLEAVVDAAFASSEGSYPVTVTNPGEPSLTSNAATLKIGPEEPVQAAALPTGVGTLTGRILNTEMWPVEGVTIKAGGLSARTNANGEFRLDGIPAGKRVVLMDGSTAQDSDGHYPTIPITVDLVANTENLLPFQPYLHRQKAYNFVNIDPGRDTILADPEVPGFEMRIPAGVNITGWDGKRNLRVSVRTVPIDRLPIKPLPKTAYARTVYMFFFDKVGGGMADRPIPIKSKNDLGLLPGEKAILWYYDESPIEGMAPNDWAIAGTGTVTPDGKYIVTDPGTGIPKFCCGATTWSKTSAPNPGTGPEECKAGDPVDPATGYFFHERVDLVVPGIIPVQIKRYYRSREGGAVFPGESADNGLGAFGKGTYFEYDWWLGTYDQMLLLIKPGNYQYRFDTQQPDGSYTNTLDPAMRGAKVTVNADNTKTLRMRDGWIYGFDSTGRLIRVEDRNGNAVSIQRHSDFEGGYIQSITTAEGKVITFNQTWIWDTFYRTDSISVSDGREVKYTYEDDPFAILIRRLPRLTQVEYQDGSAVHYGYDANGLLNTITNGRGVVEVANQYDADKRIISQTQPDSGIYNFSYSAPSGYVESTTMTAPNGAQTTWDFNADGYFTQKITPDGATTFNKAAGTNELLSITDPLGRTTTYTYYQTADITNGLLHTQTDPLGNVTTYAYENQHLGLPTTITDALGKITTFTYTFEAGTDKLTRTVITDPLGHSTTIDYNGYGLPWQVTDPNGNATTFYYDDPANPGSLTRVSDPLGNAVHYAYDGTGRLASATDAKGVATTYGYDFADRVTSVIDPLGGLTRYYYDLNGNLVWLIDSKGNGIRYEYDDRDRITKMTDQLGRYETYAYYRDAEITATTGDNLKSIIDRKGQTTTFDEYDAMGRLKQVSYGDASITQYTYDVGGRVTQIDDSLSGAIGYTYNDFGCGSCSGSALDRIASETTAAGTVGYSYDADGRRTTITFPGTADVTYTWDDAGRLVNINRTIGGAAKDFAITYDNGGRRSTLQVPLYKSKGKWQYLKTTYGFDIANRLTSLLHQNPTATIESYTWTFDANGNRKSASQSASIPLATPLAGTAYDEANEMLALDGAALTYDLNGNLESKTDTCGTTNYTWDGRNRLTGISGYRPDCSSLTASFDYDALNRRIEKTVDGVTTQYVYDGWDIIHETTGSVTTNYTRTLNIDEPLAFERSDGTVRYYKADALGSIIALTDENGVVTTTYAYDAFGNVSVSGSDVNSFQYTGRENDGTGLYYYRARYYSPEMRRYISEDPIRAAGGINYFAYVQNNPLNLIDPLGLKEIPVCTTDPAWDSDKYFPDPSYDRNIKPIENKPRAPSDLDGDGDTDFVDELIWFGGRRAWDLLPKGAPPFIPYPPGFGDGGPGTSNFPYMNPDMI